MPNYVDVRNDKVLIERCTDKNQLGNRPNMGFNKLMAIAVSFGGVPLRLSCKITCSGPFYYMYLPKKRLFATQMHLLLFLSSLPMLRYFLDFREAFAILF